MNQKDYKEIARIIRGYGTAINTCFIKELAEHFEREDRIESGVNGVINPFLRFNKKQFLKDCGVSE